MSRCAVFYLHERRAMGYRVEWLFMRLHSKLRRIVARLFTLLCLLAEQGGNGRKAGTA